MTYRTLEDIRNEIDRYRQLKPKPKTWRAIAAMPQFAGVSFATLRAVYFGRDPQTPSVRHALGLPVTAPAHVCDNCGVPHVRLTCPNKAKRPGKPRYRPTLADVKLLSWATLTLLNDPRRR